MRTNPALALKRADCYFTPAILTRVGFQAGITQQVQKSLFIFVLPAPDTVALGKIVAVNCADTRICALLPLPYEPSWIPSLS